MFAGNVIVVLIGNKPVDDGLVKCWHSRLFRGSIEKATDADARRQEKSGQVCWRCCQCGGWSRWGGGFMVNNARAARTRSRGQVADVGPGIGCEFIGVNLNGAFSIRRVFDSTVDGALIQS